MKPMARKALIAHLAKLLRTKGSWSGETHVQKSVYLSQELLSVPFDFEFILYKHGPFSFELRDELASMLADGILRQEPQPYPYGPSLVPGPLAELLETKFPKTLSKYEGPLKLVVNQIGDRKAGELERIATAYFVTRENPKAGINERVEALVSLKPHVSEDEALSAVRYVDRLSEYVRSLGI